MSTDSGIVSPHKPAIEFKSSTFSVPTLLLHTANISDIADKLAEKIQQAPEFFNNSPILLDLHLLVENSQTIDFNALVKLIRDKKLIPIALRGGLPEHNKIALKLGLAIQSHQHSHENEKNLSTSSESKSSSANSTDSIKNETSSSPASTNKAKPEAVSTTLITNPVRSGQRIYAHGDLVVLAQVSAGAEIMAEGNIHVYNSLRGRALAGVLGNIESRIFCFDLQAELISIAGIYKVNDDLDKTMQHKPVQIYLQDHALITKAL